MQDFLYRGTIKSKKVRFTYALTSSVVNTAVLQHGCDPLVSHLLGQALTSAVLISPLLEGDERYNILWKYNGAVQSILVEVGADADVRGSAAVKTLSEKVSKEAEIFGDEGVIVVTKSNSDKQLSSGNVKAGLLHVTEDLAFYFCISDQVETAMYTAVGFNADPQNPVNLCQGFLLQAMPGCDLQEFELLRQAMNTDHFHHLLGNKPANDNYFELIIKALSDQKHLDFSIYSCPEPIFKCRCNQEKVLGMLKMITKAEIEEILGSNEGVKISCHLCSKEYSLNPEEIRLFLQNQ